MVDTEIGRRIAWSRRLRGLTQNQLCRMLPESQMDRTTLAKVERGSRPLLLAEAIEIADALGVSITSLAGREPLGISEVYGESTQ